MITITQPLDPSKLPPDPILFKTKSNNFIFKQDSENLIDRLICQIDDFKRIVIFICTTENLSMKMVCTDLLYQTKYSSHDDPNLWETEWHVSYKNPILSESKISTFSDIYTLLHHFEKYLMDTFQKSINQKENNEARNT